MKITNIIFASLFLFSASIQYNDPDPFVWMTLYGMAAVACILFLLNKKIWCLPGIIAGISFLWLISLFSALADSPTPIIWADVFGRADMKTNSVELAREILGLFIVFIWMGVLSLVIFKEKNIQD